MKYILILVVWIGALFHTAMAQNSIPTENLPVDTTLYADDSNTNLLSEPSSFTRPSVIPSSPQSQIFEKYINHEITEYNGLPDISIPLYVIEIKGLKIPVTLNYHASGIKYKQFDGEVGAGWSISACGYRVSRNIYGKPDEAYSFYDKTLVNKHITGNNPYSRDSILSSICLSTREAIQIEPSIGTNVKDGEYDQFSYMLPSSSGHFIVSNRATRSVSAVGENPDLIVLDEGATKLSLNKMTITDPAGFNYLMGRDDLSPASSEYVYSEAFDLLVKTGWLLSRIESPFNEYVLFKYGNHVVHTERFRSKYYVVSDAPEHTPGNFPLVNNPGLETQYGAHLNNQYMLGASDLRLVSSIETDNVIITFIRENVFACNSDYQYPSSKCSSHVIKEIVIKDKKNNVQLKKVTFDYTKSPSTIDTNTDKIPWHRLLSTVTIRDGGNANIQKYQLEYYPAPPTPSNTFPDQWGYYKTGYTNTTVYPDMYLHDDFKTDQIVTRIGRSTVTKTAFGTVEYGVPFVSRSSGESVPNYFALKKIIYPTGGFTEYEYESNQYGTGTKGGGLRVKKITSQTDASTKALVSEYEYGDAGNGVLSGSLTLFKHCFADEAFYFTSHLSPPFGDKSPYALGTRHAIKTYGTKALDKDTELFLKVSYNKVTTKQYNSGSNSYLGKTISTYNIPFEYELSYENNTPNITYGDRVFNVSNYLGYGNAFTKKYRVGYKPIITSRTVYNGGGSVLTKDDFQYTELGKKTWEGMNVKQKIFFEKYPGTTGNPKLCEHYQSISSMYDWGYYTIEMGIKKLSNQVTAIYDQNGQNPVTTTHTYTYDALNRLSKSTQTNSLGSSLTKELTYPASGTTLSNKNMVATVVQTVLKNNNTETERVVHNYPSSAIFPDKTQHSNGAGTALQTDITYNSYDSHGNLLQYTQSDGTKVSYIWGYNYQYPIAEIENAGLNEIYTYIPQSTVNAIASKVTPASDDWTALTALQSNLKAARIAIYKYKSQVGITEATDPTGFITYYDYDNYGRLTRSYYKEGATIRVIESYNYNYVNK